VRAGTRIEQCPPSSGYSEHLSVGGVAGKINAAECAVAGDARVGGVLVNLDVDPGDVERAITRPAPVEARSPGHIGLLEQVLLLNVGQQKVLERPPPGASAAGPDIRPPD